VGPKADLGAVDEGESLLSSLGIEIRFDVRPAHTFRFTLNFLCLSEP
jgi:hypothetical protein